MRPLEILRQADRQVSASPFLETRLRAAFRQKHRTRRRIRQLVWSGALAGAFLVLAAVWRVIAFATIPVPPPPVLAVIPSAPPTEALAHSKRAPFPVRRRPLRRPNPLVSTSRTEEFLAIPYAPPFTSTDRGEVIRVQIPRQSIRSLGIPVNPERLFERVPADVLMGEDGVARAIRLVHAGEPK